MRIVEALGYILFGRPVRRRRGAASLTADLHALERLSSPPARPPARERLEERLGPDLLRELEHRLDLEGELVPARRRRRRARRAA